MNNKYENPKGLMEIENTQTNEEKQGSQAGVGAGAGTGKEDEVQKKV
jgi:hypothetical protein